MILELEYQEDELKEIEFGKVVSSCYIAIKPFEEFLLEKDFFDNLDYKNAYEYAEKYYERYPTICGCCECAN